jgi:hypothetical protein
MTQQGFEGAPRRFSVGGVVGAALPLLRRNFWHFFAIAFVLGIPLMVLIVLFAQFASGAHPPAAPFTPPGTAETVFSAAVGFVFVLTYFAIQSAINVGTLLDLRGQRPTVGHCIARGLGVLPRVFVAALLLFVGLFALTFVAVLAAYGIALAIGTSTGQMVSMNAVSAAAVLGVILLGMALFLRWWVFVPAIVVENVGSIAAFRRSATLTKGHRWGILGIVLLVFITNLACSMVIGTIAEFGAIATAALLNVVLTLAFFALSSVLVAVGYYVLRAEKEGFGLADLAQVFD